MVSKNAVLYYLHTLPTTREALRALVAHLVAYIDTDGNPRDWMFDAIIIDDQAIELDGKNHYEPDAAAVDGFQRKLFDDGQLTVFADAVSAFRSVLGDPGYRLKIYFAAPFSPDTDVVANAQNLVDRFDTLGRSELELAGFYWGYSEDTYKWDHGSVEDSVIVTGIVRLTSFAHGLGYEALWVPHFNAFGVENWRRYGFDRVVLQPNYAFFKPRHIPLANVEGFETESRFLNADRKQSRSSSASPIRS
jgi:hypothetical protein